MNYVMVAPAYPPLVGGVERHVFEVHRALRRRGLNGRIVVFNRRPASDVQAEDVNWTDSDRLWGWVARTSRLKRALGLARIVAGCPAAVLHFHDYATIYPMLPFLRLLGYTPRAYLTFHGWEGKCPPDPRVVKARQKCANVVRANIAIGHFIPKWYGTRADVISYGGVDVQLYGSVTEECYQLPFRVAYIGRLEKDSGVRELVEAAHSYCKRSGRRLELRIFGRGSLEQDLVKFRSEGPLCLSVSPPVAHSRDVLAAFPIIFASGYLTIVEALCARRIVFAYHNNSLREDYLCLHPAAQSVFVCGSEDDVMAALAQCQQNIRSACAFSDPGWRWAQEQSWDNVARQYIELWGL